MIRSLIKILLHRNTVLVMAVICGLLFGEHADHLKDLTLPVLAVVMSFSMTGIENRSLIPVRSILRPMLDGILLNYLFFSLLMLPMAWFLMPDRDLFYGFVVIVATPPGVAVIPFSFMLGGNMRHSILGTFGAFIGSVLLAPFFVYIFAGGTQVDPLGLLWLMVKLVILPFLVSRLLLLRPVIGPVKIIRGQVVNWGFALIIFVAVGMNRQVFFGDFSILLLISAVLLSSLFGMGSLFEWWSARRGEAADISLSRTLLITIKSSGFAAVTAFSLFGDRAAIPSAVLAVTVLLYLLYLSVRKDIRDRKK